MSGPRRTNAQLMSVNRAAALCGPRKPSKGKIKTSPSDFWNQIKWWELPYYAIGIWNVLDSVQSKNQIWWRRASHPWHHSSGFVGFGGQAMKLRHVAPVDSLGFNQHKVMMLWQWHQWSQFYNTVESTSDTYCSFHRAPIKMSPQSFHQVQRIVRPLRGFLPRGEEGLARLLKHRKQAACWKPRGKKEEYGARKWWVGNHLEEEPGWKRI